MDVNEILQDMYSADTENEGYQEECVFLSDHMLKHGVDFLPDMTDELILAENLLYPLLRAWLIKPTPELYKALNNTMHEAHRKYIYEWAVNLKEILEKEDITVVGDPKVFPPYPNE